VILAPQACLGALTAAGLVARTVGDRPRCCQVGTRAQTDVPPCQIPKAIGRVASEAQVASGEQLTLNPEGDFARLPGCQVRTSLRDRIIVRDFISLLGIRRHLTPFDVPWEARKPTRLSKRKEPQEFTSITNQLTYLDGPWEFGTRSRVEGDSSSGASEVSQHGPDLAAIGPQQPLTAVFRTRSARA
jgi:hypothetical protein